MPRPRYAFGLLHPCCRKAPGVAGVHLIFTLSHALAYWQEERVGFDNQLGAVERTLQAKIKDYEELLLLSGDANHAREVCPSRRGYAGVQEGGMELWAS